jgi:hypothetical protein
VPQPGAEALSLRLPCDHIERSALAVLHEEEEGPFGLPIADVVLELEALR